MVHNASLAGVLLPDLTKPKSITFFDHDLGEARWEHFILSFLILVATGIVAEALAKLIPAFFQRIVKWHEHYPEILAIIQLLVVTQGVSIERAKELLNEYRVADPSFVAHYGNSTTINETLKKRNGHHGYYRTNFFEMLYGCIRPTVYFCGASVAFYVVSYDFIAWFSSIGLSSVLVLYGFMPYIQNYIAGNILVFTDILRVGKTIEIPSHDRIGCILGFYAFSVKVGVLNKKVVEKLWGKVHPPSSTPINPMSNTPVPITSTKLKTRWRARVGHNPDDPWNVALGPFAFDNPGSSEMHRIMVNNYHTLSPTTTILPTPMPNYNISPTLVRPEDPQIVEDVESSKSNLSDEEVLELYERIMIYGYVPNSHFLQYYFETE